MLLVYTCKTTVLLNSLTRDGEMEEKNSRAGFLGIYIQNDVYQLGGITILTSRSFLITMHFW